MVYCKSVNVYNITEKVSWQWVYVATKKVNVYEIRVKLYKYKANVSWRMINVYSENMKDNPNIVNVNPIQ